MKAEVKTREISDSDSLKTPVGVSSLDTEVVANVSRRRLTASYKLRVLKRLDEAKDRKSKGLILRSEGLYSSQVSKWRKARDSGAIAELGKKKGSIRPVKEDRSRQVHSLLKENLRLEKKLAMANTIIDFQKKVLQLFKEMDEQAESGAD